MAKVPAGRSATAVLTDAAVEHWADRITGKDQHLPKQRWKSPTSATTIDWTEEAWSKFKNGTFRGLMVPRGAALSHPAANLLLKYATKGCPADCGDDWTHEQMEAAIQRGPHPSAYNDGAAE